MIVKYSKKFPYAPYLNEDIGFEMDLGVGASDRSEETIMESLKYLKSLAERFHKENNPQLTDDLPMVGLHEHQIVGNGEPFQNSMPIILPTIDPRAQETAEIAIDNATTIQDLEFYADIAVKYGLVEMYLNKKNALETMPFPK